MILATEKKVAIEEMTTKMQPTLSIMKLHPQVQPSHVTLITLLFSIQ